MSHDIREARIADLRAKLKLRDSKPGMGANVQAIKAQIAELEADAKTYRDKRTGRFTDIEHLIQNPETTVRVEPKA